MKKNPYVKMSDFNTLLATISNSFSHLERKVEDLSLFVKTSLKEIVAIKMVSKNHEKRIAKLEETVEA
jgi:hypothetical protein